MIQMKKGGDIPFTLDVPQDQEELQAWTEGRNISEISTIIQRIRSCNHPSLKEGNKEKMQVTDRSTTSHSHMNQNFLHILVEHYIVTVSTLHESDTLPLTLLDLLTRHITDMRDTSPDSLYKLCRERIVAFHESLSEKLSGGESPFIADLSNLRQNPAPWAAAGPLSGISCSSSWFSLSIPALISNTRSRRHPSS